MTVPAADLTTTHLDASTDDPSQARIELKNAIDKINAIINDLGAGNIVWTNANDGAGSGLDADLLDGQHASYYRDADQLDGQEGSYYQNASNLNSGDVPAGRLDTLSYTMKFDAGGESTPSIQVGTYTTGLYASVVTSQLNFTIGGTNNATFAGTQISLKEKVLARTSANSPGVNVDHELSSSFTGNAIEINSAMSAGSGFNLIACYASGGSDSKAHLNGNGKLYLDDGTIGTPGDYAEAFEWVDGNPANEDRVGQVVTIENGKIRRANEDDIIVGVVSAAPVVCGDAAPISWKGKYKRDDFGRIIEDENGQAKYSEEYIRHRANRIMELGGAPAEYCEDEASVLFGSVEDENERKERIDEHKEECKQRWKKFYRDLEKEYKPRLSRPEWDPVGLVGKLWVLPGEQIPSHWILLEEKENGLKRYLIK